MRKARISLFGIAFLCFLFPWVNISCGGQKVASFTGFQLASGFTFDKQNINGDPVVVFILIIVLLGLVISALEGKNGIIGSNIAGVLGLLSMIGLGYKLNNEIAREGRGLVQVDFSVGFFLLIISFVGVIGINAFPYLLGEPPVKAQVKNITVSKFCTNCGSKIDPTAVFCSECGNKVE